MRSWQKDWELCEKATPGPWDTHDGDIFDDGHGLIAIEALQKALDNLEGGRHEKTIKP